MRAQGFSDEVFDGRPVIGICNTWSELTPCNAHLRRLAESVKRGVWQAGGFPLEFPVMSLGETMLRPTAMLFRNLLSMDVEESLRGNPIDGAVLLTGCDKTTPGSIMGAASVDLPTLVVTGGPMLNGKFRGCDIGSGTAVWRFTQDLNAGRMTQEDYAAAESGMSRSNGHCMTMGTASTMACMAEALGLQLTGSAAIPAVDSRRYAIAQQAGQRIVEMVAGGPQAERHPHPRRLRQRGTGECRDRRLDQRGHPPARDRRPGRREAHAGRHGRVGPRRTVARRPAAVRAST